MVADSTIADYHLITRITHKLCDGIDLINSAMSDGLIPIFFTYLSMLIYFSFIVLQGIGNSSSLVLMHMDMGLMAFMSSLILFVLYCAHSTKSVAEEVPVIISKIMMNNEMSTNIDFGAEYLRCILLLQYRYRNIQLKSSIFNFEWGLFASVSTL